MSGTLTLLDTAWKDNGGCKDFPDTPERQLWFPEKNNMEDDARDICRLCPVIDQCLRHALIHREQGNWARMTYSERRRFAKSPEGKRFLAEVADEVKAS